MYTNIRILHQSKGKQRKEKSTACPLVLNSPRILVDNTETISDHCLFAETVLITLRILELCFFNLQI